MGSLTICLAIACKAAFTSVRLSILIPSPVLMASTDSQGSVVRGGGRGKSVEEGASDGKERLDQGNAADQPAKGVDGGKPA